MALRAPFANDGKSGQYGFEYLRTMMELALQEGVLDYTGNGTDGKFTTAAGGGLKLDVAAGAWLVKGDSGTPGNGITQGLFLVVNDAAMANVVFGSGATLPVDGTNPTVHRIVSRVRDTADLGSSADDVYYDYIAGTPTAGATLDNLNGAAAVPADAFHHADVLVAAGASSIPAGNVRDRRKRARGANVRILRNANAAAGNDYTTTSATYAAIDGTNLNPRLEISAGNPVELCLFGRHFNAAATQLYISFTVDAANVDGAGTGSGSNGAYAAGGTYSSGGAIMGISVRQLVAPAAGSHLFAPYFKADNVAGATVVARSGDPLYMTVRELIQPSYTN